MALLRSNKFLKSHLSNARCFIENSEFKGSLSGLPRGQKERPDHIRQVVSMRVPGERTEFATDNLGVHTLKELHHIAPFVCISITMQLTRVALAISADAYDSFVGEQAMRDGVSNDELRGIAHSK